MQAKDAPFAPFGGHLTPNSERSRRAYVIVIPRDSGEHFDGAGSHDSSTGSRQWRSAPAQRWRKQLRVIRSTCRSRRRSNVRTMTFREHDLSWSWKIRSLHEPSERNCAIATARLFSTNRTSAVPAGPPALHNEALRSQRVRSFVPPFLRKYHKTQCLSSEREMAPPPRPSGIRVAHNRMTQWRVITRSDSCSLVGRLSGLP